MFSQQTTQAGTVNTNEAHTQVTIDALGRAVIEGVGFVDDSCSILGDRLRNALGGSSEKTDKPEGLVAATDSQNAVNW